MPPLTVPELRSRWKPVKERLLARHPNHPTVVRMHRALSWYQRSEDAPDGQDADLVLLCQWIALNSFYGQWDTQRREPQPDWEGCRRFFHRLLRLDASGHIKAVLIDHRDLAMALLEDQYLSDYFWEDPTDRRASQSRKARYDARTWYDQEMWAMLLDRLLERVYLLRCQLAHGAATYGGKLNRQSLALCTQIMRPLLSAVLLVITDHGADEDWGVMCYPPLEEKGRSKSRPY